MAWDLQVGRGDAELREGVPAEAWLLWTVSAGEGALSTPSTSGSRSPLPTSWPQLSFVLAGKGELGVSHLLDSLKCLFPHSSDKVLDFCPSLALTLCLSLASTQPQS